MLGFRQFRRSNIQNQKPKKNKQTNKQTTKKTNKTLAKIKNYSNHEHVPVSPTIAGERNEARALCFSIIRRTGRVVDRLTERQCCEREQWQNSEQH